MNPKRILISVGMSLVLVACAFAQRPPVADQRGDRQMLQSMRECLQSLRLMRTALPIYEGHRVKAMHFTRDAIVQIRLGLDPKNRNNLSSSNGDLDVPTEDNAPLGRFTREQIRQSNLKMAQAARMLNKAATGLGSVPGEYGGHKQRAIRLIHAAISEIKLALGRFQGDRNQPPRP